MGEFYFPEIIWFMIGFKTVYVTSAQDMHDLDLCGPFY